MNHDEKDSILIGEIDFKSIFEESVITGNIGNGRLVFKGIGLCKVEVFPIEGPVPHFHIKKDQGTDLDCCLCIDTNYYFDHGHHSDKLTNPRLKQLNDWLMQVNGKDQNYTNWQYIQFTWNEFAKTNTSMQISVATKQPDYTKTVNSIRN